MQKILIIGSSGNLGTAFRALWWDGAILTPPHSELDITKKGAAYGYIAKHRPTLVVNCAAYNAVDKAESEPAVANLINGYAVGYIAIACKNFGIPFIHFSTNYVFEGKNPEGYREDDVPSPISAYGRSKLLGEQELQRYGHKFYIVRTSWLYGQGDSGKKSFMDIMLEKETEGKPIPVVRDEFGHPTDACALAIAASELVEKHAPYGIYHLVNQGSASWQDWATELFKIYRKKPKLKPVSSKSFKRKAQRPRYGILQNTKFQTNVLMPWREALRANIEMEKIMSRAKGNRS